jgi:hypothetical protein
LLYRLRRPQRAARPFAARIGGGAGEHKFDNFPENSSQISPKNPQGDESPCKVTPPTTP